MDLLADDATEGLSAGDLVELESLRRVHPEVDPLGLDLTAAALDEFLSVEPAEPMPENLRGRVEADARAYFSRAPAARAAAAAARVRRAPAPRASRPHWSVPAAVSGWIAAAAVMVWAVLAGAPPPEFSPPAPAAALRARFLTEAPDAVTLAWTATGDPAGPSASGDVVWSHALQQGYMRFRGLAANDPTVQQYQLWIFDEARDEAHPVDGGVFDIAPGVDEVVVPIQAHLPVSEAVLFAITVEKPGGVVVSSRERLPLLAKAAL
jgi:hypothetical protein